MDTKRGSDFIPEYSRGVYRNYKNENAIALYIQKVTNLGKIWTVPVNLNIPYATR